MTKFTGIVIAIAIAIATLSAPVSFAAPKSEALEISRAAGLKKLRDVSQKDMQSAIKESPDMAASNLSTTLAIGTGVFDQQTGWSLGAETGLLALGTVVSFLKAYEPEAHVRLLVWMPVDQASDAKAAGTKLTQVMAEAYSKVLPTLNVELSEKQYGGGNPGVRPFLSIDGEDCSACGVHSLTLFKPAKPKRRSAPKVIGGYKAYTWGVSGKRNAVFQGYPMEQTYFTPDQRLNFFTELSRHYPDWVYIYLPPHQDLAPFPLLLNKGEPMFFVEPAQ